MQPMTVRQVFYQATVRDIVEETEHGYAKVQNDLVRLRRSGEMPYAWIADNTRWQRKRDTFPGIGDAIETTANFYRRALCADAPTPCRDLAGKGRSLRHRFGWRPPGAF
jgi:hypothetical protein